MKTSFNQIRTRLREYYDGRPGGGPLHITLDDGNVECSSIEFCREEAQKEGDSEGQAICDMLMELTFKEREAFYASNWESLDPNYHP